jgi:hypothetical protein
VTPLTARRALAGAAIFASTFLATPVLAEGPAVQPTPLATPPAGPLLPPSTPSLGTIVPPGSRIRFHLDGPVSSNGSKAGQRFDFTMLDPVIVGSQTVVLAGAHGEGTILVAGHAGNQGHEGDLTLRIDEVATPNGDWLAFDDTSVEINGTNRKVAAALLGFVPIVGTGAFFIRGRDITVGTEVPVLIVTKNPATVTDRLDAALPSPAPTAPVHPPATPTASPTAPPQTPSAPPASPTP